MTILIVTHRDDVTADFVILGLQEQEIPFFRLNTDDFPLALRISWRSDGLCSSFDDGRRTLDSNDINAVWYRRRASPRIGTDLAPYQKFIEGESRAFMDGLWKTLDARWISPPSAIAQAEGKMGQMKFAYERGMTIPRTLVTNNPAEARQFVVQCDGKVVAKPIREKILEDSGSRRIIFTSAVSTDDLEDFDTVKLAPIILQERIAKAFEVRITAIGTQLFATKLFSQDSSEGTLDWRRSDVTQLHHAAMTLPGEIETFCLAMLERYSLLFGAFDFAVTPNGEWVFFELNPNGQWAWIEPLTGQPLRASLIRLLGGAT